MSRSKPGQRKQNVRGRELHPTGAVAAPLESRRLLSSTIYVDASAPGPTHDGTGWSTAYADLQQALAAATSAGQIDVAHATYKPTATADRTISFQLKSGVSIYGGYAGYGAANPDARDTVNTPTILSGDIGTIGNPSDNSYHVVVGGSVDATSVLDGFTVTLGETGGTGSFLTGAGLYTDSSPTIGNCIFSQNYGTYLGGGIYSSGGSPAINNCSFSGNTASSGGGGEYNSGGSPMISGCTFTNNSGGAIYNKNCSSTIMGCTFSTNSSSTGGGIYNSGGSASVSNCAFNGNQVTGNQFPAGSGGGVYNSSGTQTFTSCTFTGNSASISGGGVYDSGTASTTFTSCTLTTNSVGSNGAGGGAYFNQGGGTTVTNCTFSANTANHAGSAGSGGGIYDNGSFANISGCTFGGNAATNGGAIYAVYFNDQLSNSLFLRNTATSSGGGIYTTNTSGSSTATLTACSFQGNSAGISGGGMYNSASAPKFIDCAFVGNSAASSGGGVYNHNSVSPYPIFNDCTLSGNLALTGGALLDDSSPSLENCVLWGNNISPLGVGPQVYQTSGTTFVTYSDVQGGFNDPGNINADPCFVHNPAPGADGIWGTADDDYGDLRLQPFSPAVDAAKNLYVPSGTTTDLAGNARFQDVPTSAHIGSGTTPIVDMGAYESNASLGANAGGPYYVLQGQSIPLTGLGSSSAAGALQFSWDLNGDGVFGDASAANAVFYPAAYSAGTVVNIALMVTDAAANSVVATSTVKIVSPTLRVDARATGSNNGQDWADAFTTLSSALATAVSGQVIEVAIGTYKPTSSSDRTASFFLQPGVSIYGGYAGFGATNPDTRNVATYQTLLSGDLGAAGVTTDNSYHVVVAPSTITATTTLDGVTIVAGNANASGTNSNGGALYNSYSSVSINNCLFSSNLASLGGAAYDNAATSLMTNCIFNGNSASNGGAVYNSGGSPTLANCSFIRNSATSGGGMYNATAQPKLTSCLFSGNTATSTGGGIYDSTSSPSQTNCAFSGNTSQSGGAMYDSPASSSALINCTLSGNVASYQGGGIHSDGSFTLTNCILWADTAPSGAEIYQVSGTSTVTYSDVHISLTGTGDISTDPLFVRVPSKGADGNWGTADDDYGDLRLQSTSPCLDVGSNSAVPTGTTTDLAGVPRIIDYPGVHDPGAIVDMGAYESGSAVIVAGTPGSDSYYVSLSTNGSVLQVWNGSSPSGNPNLTYTASTLASITFNGGDGDDALFIDVSHGMFQNVIDQAGNGNDSLSIVGASGANMDVEQTSVSCGTAIITCTNNEVVYLDGQSGSSIALNSLNVAAPLSVAAGKNLLLNLAQLNVANSGKLDVNDDGLIVKNGNPATITSELKSGFNSSGGYWNGAGITSTKAATASNSLEALGASQNAAGDVAIKYTFYGDADLSGHLDGGDYTLIDSGFNSHGAKTGWQNGDFNYDGVINASDYTLIDNAFNLQGASLAAEVAPAAEVCARTGNAVSATIRSSSRKAAASSPTGVADRTSPFADTAPLGSAWSGCISAIDDLKARAKGTISNR